MANETLKLYCGVLDETTGDAVYGLGGEIRAETDVGTTGWIHNANGITYGWDELETTIDAAPDDGYRFWGFDYNYNWRNPEVSGSSMTGFVDTGSQAVVYALFVPVVTKTITYHQNAGAQASIADAHEQYSFARVRTIASTGWTNPGYEFRGWSTSSTATVPQYTEGQQIQIRDNMQLYAVWQQSLDYYVRVYANGTWHKAVPYVYSNGWHKAVPYIYNNGWHQCQ